MGLAGQCHPIGFAAWSRPRFVVISGGRGSDVEAVRHAYEATGAESLFTAHDGAVRVVIERDGLHVRSWRRTRW